MSKRVTYDDVRDTVDELIEKNKEVFDSIEFVIGMSRGGLFPAAMVATKLNKPLVTIYIDKQDNIYLDRTEWLKGKSVLFVDDICRSGLTLDRSIQKILAEVELKDLKTMTLFNPPAEEKFAEPNITLDVPEDICFPWDYDRVTASLFSPPEAVEGQLN